jgi:hypothetical protein
VCVCVYVCVCVCVCVSLNGSKDSNKGLAAGMYTNVVWQGSEAHAQDTLKERM